MRFSEFVGGQIVNLREQSGFDSPTLFREMAVLNPRAVNKVTTAMQFIHQHQIRGALLGGMAVSHYAADRPLTPDVDFLVADLPALKRILTQEGIEHQPLASTPTAGGIQVPLLDADFLDAAEGIPGMNAYILQTAQETRIGGVTVPIIAPAVLCVQKFIVGRSKDQDDAFKLLKVVRKEDLKAPLKALKKYLPNDIDAKTILSYAQAFSVS